MTSGIYEIKHVASGRTYIGSANHIERRWGEHMRTLRSGKHANAHLQNAWNKYGEDAFTFTVLMHCTPAELLSREQEYLDAGANLFNIALTSASPMTGRKWSEEQHATRSAQQRERMADPDARENTRVAMLGNTHRLGKTLTEEHVTKMRATMNNPEWRAKQSARMKAVWAAKKASAE